MAPISNSQADDAIVVEKPLRNIDYARLRRQKKWLLSKVANPHGSQEKGFALGLLNLVDAIQEYACEELGKDPVVVWGREAIDDPLAEDLQSIMEEAA